MDNGFASDRSIGWKKHHIMQKRSREMAQLLLLEIDRKLVKQTVMTSVYGVTFLGARMQILNRLKERNRGFEGPLYFHASKYAATVRRS